MNTEPKPLAAIDAITNRVLAWKGHSDAPVPPSIVEACRKDTGHRRGPDGRCKFCTTVLTEES